MEVNCFILDKGVHLLILLQVQDQLSPLGHYPELSFEWMLKATTEEMSVLKSRVEAPRNTTQDLGQPSDIDPQEVNGKGSIAFPAQT